MPASRNVLTKPWVKAILIAGPITATFGYVALLGVFYGLLYLYDVYFSSHSWRKEMGFAEWWVLISGICGILGITGIWLRLIYQERLAESHGYLYRWFVFALLLIGVFGVFWVNFGLGSYISLSNYWDIIFYSANFGLAGYGGWLAYTAIQPKR